jgi:hypothetical protein
MFATSVHSTVDEQSWISYLMQVPAERNARPFASLRTSALTVIFRFRKRSTTHLPMPIPAPTTRATWSEVFARGSAEGCAVPGSNSYSKVWALK